MDASKSQNSDINKWGAFGFDFGDGTPPIYSSAPQISRAYAESGDYTAMVIVSDKHGA